LVKTITYILAMISAIEAMKPQAKWIVKTATLQLKTDKPWSTIKAKLLVKICDTLKPKLLNYKNYDATFYIPCVLPKPGMALTNEMDYLFLLEQALKMKSSDLTINIIIMEPASQSQGAKKENTAAEGDESHKKKKKEKDPKMLPGNVAKNVPIEELRKKWECIQCKSTCIGAHCYVNPESGEHTPLSHECFDCWASAIMKGEECATLSKPPNHKLFDNHPSPVSPVLQCRLENAHTVAENFPSAPVFNISIGKNFVDLLQPPTVPQVTPMAPMLLLAHVLILNHDMSNLLFMHSWV
ncbi:hypothetical protein L208DRAFT_1320278, partial [Tricholoma matsutake]